jgi:hypothetical protein
MRIGIDHVVGQRRCVTKLVLGVQGEISVGSAEWWRSTWHVMDQGHCECPAHAADRGSAWESQATGTGHRTGVANPGSAPESQITEESGAARDSGWASGVTDGRPGCAGGDGNGRPGSVPES